MDLRAMTVLDSADIDRLIELTRDYRDGVAGGDITGFPQTHDQELGDVATLLEKLTYIRGQISDS